MASPVPVAQQIAIVPGAAEEVTSYHLPGGRFLLNICDLLNGAAPLQSLWVQGLVYNSAAAGLTAHFGGGQTNALALSASLNVVTTVAAAGDSVRLPISAPGLEITIRNDGANALQVFGAGTDTINGIATGTGVAQAPGSVATYVCSVAGNWDVDISSLTSGQPQAIAASGAVAPHAAGTYVITKAGVAALTLAAPTATADDGNVIVITSNTAFAHTLTATGLLQTGSASVNLATFAAFAGAGLTLMAYQGKWNVLASVGVTFT